MKGRGAVYVAYGGPARKAFAQAAKAFRRYCPGVPIAIVSDQPHEAADLHLQAPDADIGGRLAKLSVYDLVPRTWQRVLYMDADTEAKQDPSLYYRLLDDGYDLVICHHWGKHDLTRFSNPDNQDEYAATVAEIGSERILTLQCGVFSWRRSQAARRFFLAWRREWRRWGKRDQAAMLRALWAYPLRVCVLPPIWNQRATWGRASNTVIAHHFNTARRYGHGEWKRISRFDAPEAWGIVKG